MFYEAEFPGLGNWPPKKWYRNRQGNKTKVSLRLPGTLRVKYETWTHFEWWVPTGEDEHIYVQLAAMDRGRAREPALPPLLPDLGALGLPRPCSTTRTG